MDNQEGDGMCITEEQMEPCPDEQDMPLPTRTESLQGTWVIYEQIGIRLFCKCSFVVAKGGHHPSPDNRDGEQDMLPIGTEHLQDTTDIESCPNNDPMPVPAGTNEVQVLATGARARGGVTTTRQRSALLRRPAPAIRIPYTREST
ncbi:Hypothetical predicted protein, partial [Olea europaea subsp. europaea]